MRDLNELDEMVLRALPMNGGGATWPTASVVAATIASGVDVAQSVLTRLACRSLVEHDGGWPRRWARTVHGDRATEWIA